MAYCNHICRVLEHAQVCAAGTSALTWQSLLWLLFAIFSSAAHIRGLSSSTHLCSGPGRPYLQIIEACISVHDQYRPSSLLQSQTMGGCGVCWMLAELFLQNGTWTRFSESAVRWSDEEHGKSKWYTLGFFRHDFRNWAYGNKAHSTFMDLDVRSW